MAIVRPDFAGLLLGMAVGDALGLPYESLSKRRGRRLLGVPNRYRFLFRRGMISDDTEHACLTAQALIASAGEPDAFLRQLARRVRWWFLGISAGIGRATLRSSIRLWLGVSPRRSGVNSAGNGGLMRSVVLGAALHNNIERLKELTGLSSRISHRNELAERSALIIALAAAFGALAVEIDSNAFLESLESHLDWPDDCPLRPLIHRAIASAENGESTQEFAASLGLQDGVSGYVVNTTPVVLHAWLRYGSEFENAIQDCVLCGGDTDTIAGIVGALIAVRHGVDSIPPHLIDGICEWPRTAQWMCQLGSQLDRVLQTGIAEKPSRLPWWGLVPRNVFFLFVVLIHALRRLAPPY